MEGRGAWEPGSCEKSRSENWQGLVGTEAPFGLLLVRLDALNRISSGEFATDKNKVA